MLNIPLYILFTISMFFLQELYFILNKFVNLYFMIFYQMFKIIGEDGANALEIRVIVMMAPLITKHSVYLKETKHTKL